MSAPKPAFETILAESRTVACDGGALGHPRVFLTIGPTNEVQCPYCSRLYVLSGTAHDDHAHG